MFAIRINMTKQPIITEPMTSPSTVPFIPKYPITPQTAVVIKLEIHIIILLISHFFMAQIVKEITRIINDKLDEIEITITSARVNLLVVIWVKFAIWL